MKKEIIIFLMTAAFTAAAPLFAGITLNVEAGGAFSGYNDVQIPGDNDATRFSLTDDLSSDPVFSYRVNLSYRLNDLHRISLLYAPLKIKPSGTVDRDVIFQNTTFPSGDLLSAVYRFDSYRLQYRYFFRNQDMFLRAVGASIKLRDAEISIRSETDKAKKTNTGFVPLLNLLLAWDVSPRVSLLLDGEGLWSPFGRAADIFTGLTYRIDNHFTLRAGYRILEGGSDGDEVYSFALINYLVIGASVRL